MALTIHGTNGITFNSTSVQGDAGIGYGQSWTSVTGSRASGTTYTNSTTKPIFVMVAFNQTSGCTITINGTSYGSLNSYSQFGACFFIVPAGATYVVTAPYAIQSWSELR